jgi:2-succinyl-5-enolpyruvyl-6-hydroxy-3-cyclohexene-1-carboxylate synthase
MLITGDTAFHYDRNGLWLSQGLPQNIKIVVVNNGGGAIFGLIDGPSGLPEQKQFFYNPNQLTAERTAADFGLVYYNASDRGELKLIWTEFMAEAGPALIELFTSPNSAKAHVDALKIL